MKQALLADIGGTYTRLWLLNDGQVVEMRTYAHKTRTPIKSSIHTFLTETKARPIMFVAGAAGQLDPAGKIKLTNGKLMVNMPRLCQTFGFKIGLLANDMVFHTASILGQPDSKNACVIVIGTGLGCAYIRDGRITATEAGHTPIPRRSEVIKSLDGHIWEDIVSGPAFLRIYHSLSDKPVTRSRDVSFLAHNYNDRTALMTYKIMAQTLAHFCLTVYKKHNIPVFYLGGLAIELIRSERTRQVFFDTLGRMADVLSIRIIRPTDESALTGLKIIAQELTENGTTNMIRGEDFYLY